MTEARQQGDEVKKKRRRGGHNSACWICQRDHRACDSSRPCKRCVTIGTAEECVHPPPKRDAKPKRRKFVMISSEAFSPSTSTTPSSFSAAAAVPVQSSKPHTKSPPIKADVGSETPLLRNNQFSGWQWQTSAPSASSFHNPFSMDTSSNEAPIDFQPVETNSRQDTEDATPNVRPAQRRRKRPAAATQPSHPTQQQPQLQQQQKQPPHYQSARMATEPKTQPAAGERQDLLMDLLKEVRHLNETTFQLREEHDLLTRQISILRQDPAAACDETTMLVEVDQGFTSEEDFHALSSPASSPQVTSSFMINFGLHSEDFGTDDPDVPPPVKRQRVQSPEAYQEEEQQDQQLALVPMSQTAIPNDLDRLSQSAFLPFVIDDPTKPFVILRPILKNLELFMELLMQQGDIKRAMQMNMLHASDSFCKLVKYEEHEIIGPQCDKLFPNGKPDNPQKRQLLPYIIPKKRHIHVSPPVVCTPRYQAKDGMFVYTSVRIQFFYNDEGVALPSFAIISVDESTVAPPPAWWRPGLEAPQHPGDEAGVDLRGWPVESAPAAPSAAMHDAEGMLHSYNHVFSGTTTREVESLFDSLFSPLPSPAFQGLPIAEDTVPASPPWYSSAGY